jgi:hypothetical protein
MSDRTQTREWYAGNNQYISTPGGGDAVIATSQGELISAARHELRWRNPVIFVGILTLVGSVVVGLISTGGNIVVAWLTRAPAAVQTDPCRDAAAHFHEAQVMQSATATRDMLQDHLVRFGSCNFVGAAKIALNNLSATTRSPPFQSQPQAAPAYPGPAPSTDLPPIVVSPPATIARSSRPGTRFTYTETDVYRISPTLRATTTYRVIAGSATVIMDGMDQGDVWRGNTFRLFTVGWSRFEIEPMEPNTVIEIVDVAPGDHIQSRGYFRQTAY